MSGKANKRPLRALTAHEKLDAIRRVHDGESKASVARDIGVPESTLRGWCKNEDKISYLSRQSSPETDESLDRSTQQNKKQKLDESFTQPFNLSLKTHNSFALTSTNLTDGIDVKPLAPLNLQNTNSSAAESTPKSTNHLSERERNRAELARLSVELGLNRPEMFLPNLNNSSLLTDFSTNISLIAQWNALLAQQQQIKALQTNKSPQVSTSADTTNAVSSSNSLLTTVDQEKNSQLPKDMQSVHESVWYWLKTQQMLNMNNSVPTSIGMVNNQLSPVNGVSSHTTTAIPSSSTPSGNGVSPDQSSWFWKWYKQFSYKEQDGNKPILYQQLTKEAPQKDYISTPFITDQQNAENLSLKDEKQRLNGNKARSVLDNLLFNNNINLTTENKQNKEDNDVLSQTEALVHGEKFLNWLESCSDPSVTAVQIMQFKSLLNNVKSGVDRKNCDLQNKTKVKRK